MSSRTSCELPPAVALAIAITRGMRVAPSWLPSSLDELEERRFANFQKLNAEQAHNSRSLAERRERDRKMGRFFNSVLKDKRRLRD